MTRVNAGPTPLVLTGSSTGSGLSRQGSGDWLADVSVDQTDPFFFDHPLDHVPGMLLVCAVADQARDRGSVPEDGRLKAVVNFRSLSGFSPGLVLLGDAAGNGRRNVRITQGPTVVADGWFEASPEPEPQPEPQPGWPGRACAGGPSPVPAGAALVHRVRPENVMLGEPTVAGGQVTAAVLLPPVGHALYGRRIGRRPVRALIESGRQFITWLMHRVAGWPLDTQMLWLKLTADLPFGLPWSAPVVLRWQCTSIPGHRVRLCFDLIAGDGRDGGGRKVGSLVYLIMGLPSRGGTLAPAPRSTV